MPACEVLRQTDARPRQAIARVNRVFRAKHGGQVVDYLGLADQLKRALDTCAESGSKGDPTYPHKYSTPVSRKPFVGNSTQSKRRHQRPGTIRLQARARHEFTECYLVG